MLFFEHFLCWHEVFWKKFLLVFFFLEWVYFSNYPSKNIPLLLYSENDQDWFGFFLKKKQNLRNVLLLPIERCIFHFFSGSPTTVTLCWAHYFCPPAWSCNTFWTMSSRLASFTLNLMETSALLATSISIRVPVKLGLCSKILLS